MIDFFSNRELAVLIWLAILLITLLLKGKIQENIIKLIKCFFDLKIIIPLGLLILYVLLLIFVLIKAEFWEVCLLKDTLFWFGSTAFITFFNIQKSEKAGFFKNIIKDNLKFVIILEFLLNFHTFSFLLEFILVPCLFVLSLSVGILEYQAQKDKSFTKITELLKNILVIYVLVALGFVIYKSVIGYRELFSISNLRALLLPAILTVLSLPFFYLLAIFMQYDVLFPVLSRLFSNNGKVLTLNTKVYILYSANFSLKRWKKIRKNSARIAFSNEKPEKVISDILRIPLHKRSPIGNNSKLHIFNDIEKVRSLLSKIGIGELSEWDYDSIEEYHCMTDYFSFGSFTAGIQNNIAFYLVGGELFIRKLELVLNINNKVENEAALEKFKDITEATFKCLSLPNSSNLMKSITMAKGFSEEFDTFNIQLIKDISRIVTLKLIIESKGNS